MESLQELPTVFPMIFFDSRAGLRHKGGTARNLYPTWIETYREYMTYWGFSLFLSGHTSRCRTDSNKENFITLKGSRGSLVSPGYPNSYPIITCTWRLVVPDGHILEMDVQDFEMSCDGKSKLQVGQEVFCGSKKPQGLLTSDSDLTVRMIVTESQNNRGFRAEFVTKEKGNYQWYFVWFWLSCGVCNKNKR